MAQKLEAGISALSQELLAMCLVPPSTAELAWEVSARRSLLRLVCKRWNKVILEAEESAHGIVFEMSQAQARLARFPADDQADFCSLLVDVLIQTPNLTHLAVMLPDDTITMGSAFDQLMLCIEGLRELRALAILPSEYRSFNPVRTLPLSSFIAFVAQPKLERFDVCYLPSSQGNSANLPSVSPALKHLLTEPSGPGREHFNQPGERGLESWLYTPAQMQNYESVGIIDFQPFETMVGEHPDLFTNLRSLRIDYADLPLFDSDMLADALSNLEVLSIDGITEDTDFSSLSRYRLDTVSFLHDCYPDASMTPHTDSTLDSQGQFDKDVLASLVSLADGGNFPFRRLVLRCHASCGALEHLEQVADICRTHGAVFERKRGFDVGWATI